MSLLSTPFRSCASWRETAFVIAGRCSRLKSFFEERKCTVLLIDNYTTQREEPHDTASCMG